MIVKNTNSKRIVYFTKLINVTWLLFSNPNVSKHLINPPSNRPSKPQEQNPPQKRNIYIFTKCYSLDLRNIREGCYTFIQTTVVVFLKQIEDCILFVFQRYSTNRSLCSKPIHIQCAFRKWFRCHFCSELKMEFYSYFEGIEWTVFHIPKQYAFNPH